MRWIIIVLVAMTCGCATGPKSLPLTTPDTFEQGLRRIDKMLTNGHFAEARDYADRHKNVDPVIYWAFQVHMSTLWDHSPRRIPAMKAYPEFLKAYQERYLVKKESNQASDATSEPAPGTASSSHQR